MNRRLAKLLVVIMVVAVSWAPAASAVGGGQGVIAQVSINTDDQDFNNAQELTNLHVVGSGDSAHVDETGQYQTTSFDNVDDNGDGSYDTDIVIAGDSTNDEVIKSEVETEVTADGTVDSFTLDLEYIIGSDYDTTIDIYAVQEGADDQYGEGTLIKSNLDFGTLQGTDGTVTIDFDTSIQVQQGEKWTFEFITQGTDNDGQSDMVHLDADDSVGSQWYSNNINLEENYLGAISFEITETKPDSATYIGQPHAVDFAQEAFIDLSLGNASATVTWQGWTGSTWTNIAQNTRTSSGNYTVTALNNNHDKYRVKVEFSSTDIDPNYRIDDEGINAQTHIPELDESSATPSGGTNATEHPLTLEIDVNDTDFGTGQGDSVTVEFFDAGGDDSVGGGDDEKIGETTLTSNGTASVEWGDVTGGNQTWYAEATDEYGNNVTTSTFDFSTPGNLFLRPETAPNDLINGSGVNVTVTFYGEDEALVQRTVSDGKVNMTGLPVDERLVVTATSDDYYSRTVIIESLFDSQTVYLLNDSVSAVQTTFTVDDRTGDFENPTVTVQRALNVSGETDWTTIAADTTDPEGFTVTLEEEVRYRVLVENADGDVREYAYTAPVGQSDAVTIVIGELTFELQDPESVIEWNASRSGGDVYFNFTDPVDNTSSITVTVYEYQNESNTLFEKTYSGPLGTLQVVEALSSSEQELSVVVEWSGTRDGESVSGSTVLGVGKQSPGIPMDPIWREFIAGSLLVVTAGFVGGGVRAELGAVAVALEAAVFWYIDWLPNEVGAGILVLTLLIGGLYYASSSEAGI